MRAYGPEVASSRSLRRWPGGRAADQQSDRRDHAADQNRTQLGRSEHPDRLRPRDSPCARASASRIFSARSEAIPCLNGAPRWRRNLLHCDRKHRRRISLAAAIGRFANARIAHDDIVRRRIRAVARGIGGTEQADHRRAQRGGEMQRPRIGRYDELARAASAPSADQDRAGSPTGGRISLPLGSLRAQLLFARAERDHAAPPELRRASGAVRRSVRPANTSTASRRRDLTRKIPRAMCAASSRAACSSSSARIASGKRTWTFALPHVPRA